jgi:hypothetical protein
MENWSIVYETSTGQAVSAGTVLTDPLPSHLSAFTMTPEQSEAFLAGLLCWDAGTRDLVEMPRPSVSAIEHLESVGMGADYQPTLIYLRIKLNAANKTCVELDDLESYLQNILTMFAIDQSPRNDWSMPPIAFNSVVVAALQTLSS